MDNSFAKRLSLGEAIVSMNIRGNRARSHLQNQLDRYLIGLQTRKLEARRRGLRVRILHTQSHISLALCLKTNQHPLPLCA